MIFVALKFFLITITSLLYEERGSILVPKTVKDGPCQACPVPASGPCFAAAAGPGCEMRPRTVGKALPREERSFPSPPHASPSRTAPSALRDAALDTNYIPSCESWQRKVTQSPSGGVFLSATACGAAVVIGGSGDSGKELNAELQIGCGGL